MADASSGTPATPAAPAAVPHPPQAHSGVSAMLHPKQFAGIAGSTSVAAAAGAAAPIESPLSLMPSTLTSAAAASTWRKPSGVLPYNKATMGSTFQPF